MAGTIRAVHLPNRPIAAPAVAGDPCEVELQLRISACIRDVLRLLDLNNPAAITSTSKRHRARSA